MRHYPRLGQLDHFQRFSPLTEFILRWSKIPETSKGFPRGYAKLMSFVFRCAACTNPENNALLSDSRAWESLGFLGIRSPNYVDGAPSNLVI